MNAYEYTKKIEDLERKLRKAEHDRDRYKRYIAAKVTNFKVIKRLNDYRSRMLATSLFAVIKNSKVAPKGMELGKTPEEIDDMTYETMLEISNMIDFEVVNKALSGAERRYSERHMAKFKEEKADSGVEV